MNLSLPELCKVRTTGTQYSTKSTYPESLIQRTSLFSSLPTWPTISYNLFLYLQPFNEAWCYRSWSGDIAGPLSHIYSTPVMMARKTSTRVLLNHVLNKGSSGSLQDPRLLKQFHQRKLRTLASTEEILCLQRKRSFQEKVLTDCYERCHQGSRERLTKLHVRKVPCAGQVSGTVPGGRFAASRSGVRSTGFGY